MYIAGVCIVKPSEIPDAIPHWHREDLLEKPTKGWDREIIPPEVLAFFGVHPGAKNLVFSDGYIYERPPPKSPPEEGIIQDPASTLPLWRRYKNYAPMVLDIIERNQEFKSYMDRLVHLIGQEVEPPHLFPNWEQTRHGGIHKVPMKDELFLKIHEVANPINAKGVVSIDVMCQGPRMDRSGNTPSLYPILIVGSIEYKGRPLPRGAIP